MAASDKPPVPPRPKTNGHAVLEPPRKPPAALSAEKRAPSNAPFLLVVHTKEARLLGHRFFLDSSPFLIGGGAENDVVLNDARVSPRHARLEARDAAWWCVDDGSTCGLYINDRPVRGPAMLQHGARIGIGSTIFKFLSGSDSEVEYHHEIYQLTVRDGLTEAYIQRYLVEVLDKEVGRARRRRSALALLMVEVDEIGAMEHVDDLPNAGDHVLREVVRILQPAVPRDGMLGRYGNQAFAIVLPETPPETARALAKSLCDKVAKSRLQVGARELQATISIGTARREDEDRTSAEILERARRALEVARSHGRSQHM